MCLYHCYIHAFILAMAGVIMVTYTEAGFTAQDVWRCLLIMVATSGAAAFKVIVSNVIHYHCSLGCTYIMIHIHSVEVWLGLALFVHQMFLLKINTIPNCAEKNRFA